MKINELKKQINQQMIEMDLDDVLFMMKMVLLKYNDALVSERQETVKNGYEHFGDAHDMMMFELDEFIEQVETYRDQARYMIEREETLRIKYEDHLQDKCQEYMSDEMAGHDEI